MENLKLHLDKQILFIKEKQKYRIQQQEKEQNNLLKEINELELDIISKKKSIDDFTLEISNNKKIKNKLLQQKNINEKHFIKKLDSKKIIKKI